MADRAAFFPEHARAATNRVVDETVDALKRRLLRAGWEVEIGDPILERERFANLIPAPDATFTVRNPATGAECPVAIHLADCAEGVSYAYTMCLPEGYVVYEHGRLNAATGKSDVVEARGSLDEPPPDNSRGEVAAPGKDERRIRDEQRLFDTSPTNNP